MNQKTPWRSWRSCMSHARKKGTTSQSSSRGGRGGRLKTCGVAENAPFREKKTMPRQSDCVSVSKTGAKLGTPRRRPNLQNPNGWQSTSSNRTARLDASGWPPTDPNSNQKQRAERGMNVGIDVSKSHLDVHVHETGEAFRVGNDDAGIDELIAHLSKLTVERVVME